MRSAELYRTDGRDFKSIRVTLKDDGAKGGGGRLLYLLTRKQGRQKRSARLPRKSTELRDALLSFTSREAEPPVFLSGNKWHPSTDKLVSLAS